MIDLETLELKHGSHTDCEDGMCVMEAVSCWIGGPFTDTPETSSPVIGAFLRNYNDSVNHEVRQSLKQYIPRLANSRGTDEVEEQRAMIMLDWLVRVNAVAWLRAAGLVEHAEELASLAPILTKQDVRHVIPALNAAGVAAGVAAWAAARDAAWAAAGAAAWAAARDAAGAAARAAAWAAAGAAAWDAARDAAWAAAGAAAGAAAWDAAWAAARDAAWDAAWAAAGDAAWDVLRPTVLTLQAAVPELLNRVLALTEGECAQ